METLSSQNSLLLNNINAFERERNLSYSEINELSTLLQIPPSTISSLGNINNVLKFYKLRNAILSNKKVSPFSNASSITIPATADYGIVEKKQSSKGNFSFKNIASDDYIDSFDSIKSKSNIPSITVPNISIPNEINPLGTPDLSPLLNDASINYSEFENKSNSPFQTNILMNNLNDPYSNNLLFNTNSTISMPINATSSYSGNQLSLPTSSLLNNSYALNSNTMNNKIINNNVINNITTNNNATNNYSSKKIELLDFILKFQKKYLDIRNQLNELNSINIPSSPSIGICQNNNQFIQSVSIPSETENNVVPPYLQSPVNNCLLKEKQDQQQLITPTNESSIFGNSNSIIGSTNNLLDKNIDEDKPSLDIPSIVINNDLFDICPTSKPISIEKNNETPNNDIFDFLMKSSTPSIKQDQISDYTPLSPALSPLLNVPNISTTDSELFQNCMIKNGSNSYSSSSDTLNDILSITPEMGTLEMPNSDKENSSCKVKDDDEIDLDNILKSFEIDLINEENSNDKLSVDNDFLTAPATPKSDYDISNIDYTDFSGLTKESFDDNMFFIPEMILNNSFSNNEDENVILNINEESNEINNNIENIIPKIIVENVDEKVESSSSSKHLQEQEKTFEEEEKEKPKITKRPRGRPRKNKKVEELKEEKNEEKSKSMIKKSLIPEEESNSLNSKKECFDCDYKFIKQLNTLNYVMVSNETIGENREFNTKTNSEDTENQYDIPLINSEDDIKSMEYKNSSNIDNNISNSMEMDNDYEYEYSIDENGSSISDNESEDSFIEEESLLTRKKEIQQQKCINEANESKMANRNNRKRKCQNKEEKEELMNKEEEVYVNTITSKNKKRKVVRLSIKQIKNSLENGNRLSIGNSLESNSVSALTQNGLVLVGRKRMIAENTNRPYVCSTCGAGFVRKHDLNRHEKVHSGVKNYKCPYCERAFSRNDALSRHLRVELKHRSQENGNKKKKSKKNN